MVSDTLTCLNPHMRMSCRCGNVLISRFRIESLNPSKSFTGGLRSAPRDTSLSKARFHSGCLAKRWNRLKAKQSVPVFTDPVGGSAGNIRSYGMLSVLFRVFLPRCNGLVAAGRPRRSTGNTGVAGALYSILRLVSGAGSGRSGVWSRREKGETGEGLRMGRSSR